MFVKDLRHNLLSVQCLVKNGLKVIFDGDKVILEKDSVLLACGYKQNNLYQLELEICHKCEVNFLHPQVLRYGIRG